jgi:hypothetical protein
MEKCDFPPQSEHAQQQHAPLARAAKALMAKLAAKKYS